MRHLLKTLCALLAVAVVATAAALMPPRARARYHLEWRAELQECERQGIGPLPPALRILAATPAMHRALRFPRRFLRDIGDRIFAANDAEACWRKWDITRLHGGAARQYRDPRFSTRERTPALSAPAGVSARTNFFKRLETWRKAEARDEHARVPTRFRQARVSIVTAAIAALGFLAMSKAAFLGFSCIAKVINTAHQPRNGMARVREPHARARERTAWQLNWMRREMYFTLDARAIPNSRETIDHLVIGPTGVYAIDSETWNKAYPIRTLNGKRLYHGPESKKDRLEYAAWQALQASELISAALGYPVRVQPALAIYGPKVPSEIATIGNVDVYTGPSLRKYLKQYDAHADGATVLTREQTRAIFDTALQLLPNAGPSRAYSPVP